MDLPQTGVWLASGCDSRPWSRYGFRNREDRDAEQKAAHAAGLITSYGTSQWPDGGLCYWLKVWS